MLTNLHREEDASGACVSIRDACFPAPFSSGLEYAAPARGTWNIVHTGMLLPEGHEIFVCAAGCLRGVVLTAAEMNAEHRFSTIAVRENNILEGDMEDLIVDGVTDILERLPKHPPAIMLYTSCVHHFIGCDLPLVYRRLGERFPDIDFTDCYMNPIMRKSGLTPDQLMRRQLYSLLKPCPPDEKAVNIIGNDLPTDDSSDLAQIVQNAGFTLRDISDCKTYEEYQQMASAVLNITTQPAAIPAARALNERLHQKHLHLPACFGYGEITDLMHLLQDSLGIFRTDFSEQIARCEDALSHAGKVIGSTPIAIDYTAAYRPCGMARLLCEHGFFVVRIYADNITGEDKADFEYLKEHYPDIDIYPTVHAKMRYLKRSYDEKLLAIGQKAAYFTGSDYFVNIVEGGGLYGFDGICRLAALMEEAFLSPKDAKNLIQIKGMGCTCV